MKEVAMPRFCFAIHYLSITEDLGELELPNLAAAHSEALRVTRAYLAPISATGLDPTLCSVEISEWVPQVVQVIPFGEVNEASGQGAHRLH
jgi:hypothetical protein